MRTPRHAAHLACQGQQPVAAQTRHGTQTARHSGHPQEAGRRAIPRRRMPGWRRPRRQHAAARVKEAHQMSPQPPCRIGIACSRPTRTRGRPQRAQARAHDHPKPVCVRGGQGHVATTFSARRRRRRLAAVLTATTARPQRPATGKGDAGVAQSHTNTGPAN
jgi:hypothetical protein